MDDGIVCVRKEDGFASYRTPTHADFLLAHSSVEGYFSWRNTIQGSWFIQVGLILKAKLNFFNPGPANAATHDLDSIMNRVAKVVATEYISNSNYEK